jgi:hypothetical protein
MQQGIERRATVYAGIAAGVTSALGQMLLWLAFTDAFPEILLRDASLAAAIVLGPEVLPPPVIFDAKIILVATLIHFSLSIAYGFALAWVLGCIPRASSVLTGALFGLALYAVNMYGFNALFPWFAQARDWITIAAHLIFGITAAAVYRRFPRR